MFNTLNPKYPCRYVIGIDVGIRGIGLAALEVDDDGFVIKVLASTVVRIDGGETPESSESRKAAAGKARRQRHLYKNRRRRLKALDSKLREYGYPVENNAHTYEPWEARDRLVTTYIHDEEEKRRLVSIALRHIARHRGWRNPWLSWTTFSQVPTPSTNHQRNLQLAEERFGRDFTGYTVGQLGYLGSNRSIQIRPRTSLEHGLHLKGERQLFIEKILQEDQLAEIRQIWQTQDLPKSEFEDLVQAVFFQKKPYVPMENVGKDVLPGMRKHYRAMRASLEFQEYRIRTAIGNLRVCEKGATRPLSAEENAAVFDLLSTWHQQEGLPAGVLPSWADVAEVLDIKVTDLLGRESEESAASRPPVMRTLIDLETKIKGLSREGIRDRVLEWYQAAEWEEISALISWLSDATDASENLLEDSGVADKITDWGDEALESLSNIDLEAGRAAYSAASLIRLNKRMREDAVDVHTARKLEFGVDDDWRPPLPNLDERVGQPTVDQNLTYVRRFVMAAARNWGLPLNVNVEHVRDAFLGPAAREALKSENRRRADERENYRKNLSEVLGKDVTRIDIRKYEYIQRQNSQCAYCGASIAVGRCDLDHIVPRAGGGSTNRANLVAICRDCNAKKSNIPFAVWADMDPRTDANGEKLVTQSRAKNRIKGWMPTQPSSAQKMEHRELLQRISQTEEDPIDERSMESTAYAATAIRDRLTRFYTDIAEEIGQETPPVRVYQGAVVASARKASEVDHLILLRGKNQKNRGDFRHHALDAAVIAMMEPSIAQTLSIRGKRRAANYFNPDEPGWKDFTGLTPGARESFGKWTQRMHSLAEVMAEAIQNDRISVQNPLRLSRNVGRLHAAKPTPLTTKPVNSVWEREDINRIVDRNEFLLFSEASQHRTLKVVPDHIQEYFRDKDSDSVRLFSGKSGEVFVRNGGAPLGTIHHARVLRWKDTKGNYKFGMQRVYAGELQEMWPDQSTDLFTAEIPEWSMSKRDLATMVARAEAKGIVTEVGWVAPGDEMELDIEPILENRLTFARYLSFFPERRWFIAGYNDAGILLLRPLYLSSERELAADEENSPKFNKIYIGVDTLFRYGRVVRRNILGTEVLRSKNMPASFDPMTAVGSEKLRDK